VASTELDPVRDAIRCIEENQAVSEHLWRQNAELRLQAAALESEVDRLSQHLAKAEKIIWKLERDR
jgi:hypothetical protein